MLADVLKMPIAKSSLTRLTTGLGALTTARRRICAGSSPWFRRNKQTKGRNYQVLYPAAYPASCPAYAGFYPAYLGELPDKNRGMSQGGFSDFGFNIIKPPG